MGISYRWRNNCTPSIGNDGTIYLGSGDHSIYALNPNGTKKWEFLTGGITRHAVVSNGGVYVGSEDKKLYG